jgi:hypothetical protein
VSFPSTPRSTRPTLTATVVKATLASSSTRSATRAATRAATLATSPSTTSNPFPLFRRNGRQESFTSTIEHGGCEPLQSRDKKKENFDHFANSGHHDQPPNEIKTTGERSSTPALTKNHSWEGRQKCSALSGNELAWTAATTRPVGKHCSCSCSCQLRRKQLLGMGVSHLLQASRLQAGAA